MSLKSTMLISLISKIIMLVSFEIRKTRRKMDTYQCKISRCDFKTRINHLKTTKIYKATSDLEKLRNFSDIFFPNDSPF